MKWPCTLQNDLTIFIYFENENKMNLLYAVL